MAEEKYVDESWKDSVAQEKEKLQKQGAAAPAAKNQKIETSEPAAPQKETPENADPVFVNYISSLAYQAMFFLGEVPNPVDNTTEVNLEQAKFIIDTLLMLRTKTQGNLAKQEADMLNAATYELQMKFVELNKKK